MRSRSPWLFPPPFWRHFFKFYAQYFIHDLPGLVPSWIKSKWRNKKVEGLLKARSPVCSPKVRDGEVSDCEIGSFSGSVHPLIGTLLNYDGDNNATTTLKSNRFSYQNNNSPRASRLFVHFYAVPARLLREMTKFKSFLRTGTARR